jgi:hypothetical protein
VPDFVVNLDAPEQTVADDGLRQTPCYKIYSA